jgi:uncharacterized protein
VIVADTGPLYALIDRSDAWHLRVAAWWSRTPRNVVVPVVVLPEVCYLLQTRISVAAECAFVRAVARGEFVTEPVESVDVDRAAELMQTYADLPLGFVDAMVVATAERLGAREILTTDRRHFGIVQSRYGGVLALSP